MKKLLGGIFLGIGILMSSISGVCASMLIFMMDEGIDNSAETTFVLALFLPPLVIGLCLAVLGWLLVRWSTPRS